MFVRWTGRDDWIELLLFVHTVLIYPVDPGLCVRLFDSTEALLYRYIRSVLSTLHYMTSPEEPTSDVIKRVCI